MFERGTPAQAGGVTELKSQRSKFGEDNETGNQWAEYLKGESVREKTLEICKGVPLSIWLITYMHA